MDDLKLLLALVDEHSHELTEGESEAFQDMLDRVRRGGRMSLKQKQWAQKTLEKFQPTYENLVSSGQVPRGKEVPLPEVLRNLPMRPPGR